MKCKSSFLRGRGLSDVDYSVGLKELGQFFNCFGLWTDFLKP